MSEGRENDSESDGAANGKEIEACLVLSPYSMSFAAATSIFPSSLVCSVFEVEAKNK